MTNEPIFTQQWIPGAQHSGPSEPLTGRDHLSGEWGRVRANPRDLELIPRADRLANLVCARVGRTLFGVVTIKPVYGRAVTTSTATRAGFDFKAQCACGWDHFIVGTALAEQVKAIAGQPHRRGYVPTISVQRVERSATDPNGVPSGGTE